MDDREGLLAVKKAERMSIHIYSSRSLMGAAAAVQVGEYMRRLLEEKDRRVRMVFAAAPSQSELYEGLVREQGIDWPRVEAFHMDEYIGLDSAAPQSFGTYLTARLFSRVKLLDCWKNGLKSRCSVE